VRRTRVWIYNGPRSVSVNPLIGDQVRPVLAVVAWVRLRGIFCDNSGPRIVALLSQKIIKIARISPGLVDGG
jgi:hypothetical protein